MHQLLASQHWAPRQVEFVRTLLDVHGKMRSISALLQLLVATAGELVDSSPCRRATTTTHASQRRKSTT